MQIEVVLYFGTFNSPADRRVTAALVRFPGSREQGYEKHLSPGGCKIQGCQLLVRLTRPLLQCVKAGSMLVCTM